MLEELKVSLKILIQEHQYDKIISHYFTCNVNKGFDCQNMKTEPLPQGSFLSTSHKEGEIACSQSYPASHSQ